ncbi:ribulose-phosphate 3-epimerase [Chitinophagaceae bacterium IBVUCB1]|nr:ribulose-phosphate 3-epimerase [Chitinophagaceae bacterium IBVUCB1]
MPIIAPSMLSADFLNLGRDIDMVNNSEADWFHLDVMDGRFVPNISYGMPIIAQMKKMAKKTMDVHLMIVEPEKYFEDFKKAGADILTVHYEASTHLHRSLQAIKALGMKAGVSLNPHTPVHLLEDVITEIDLVLIMSVNPGFGGQKFIQQAINKIAKLKAMINATGSNALIEVDGGVTLDNAAALVAAGADALVAGNTVFSSADPADTIKKLKQAGK